MAFAHDGAGHIGDFYLPGTKMLQNLLQEPLSIAVGRVIDPTNTVNYI